MRFVLLLGAALIAVVAGIAALKWANQSNPPAQVAVSEVPQQRAAQVSTVDVLVAREEIPVGTVIKEDMIDRQPWPSHLVLEGFIVANSPDANVVGQVARATFLPNEPLLKSRLGNPNDPSFLAAALPEGMRAITLSTDAISGVAGYIFPGDRVDILLTHNVPRIAEMERNTKSRGVNNRYAYSEVLVPNARVLAVNLRGVAENSKGVVPPSSITVEVSEQVAEEVRLAEKLGTISLALRSLKDMQKFAKPAPATFGDITNVDIWRSGSPVRVVRGVKMEEGEEPSSMESTQRTSLTPFGGVGQE